VTTESRIFLGIGAFLVAAAVLYGVTAREVAGTTMLALAGTFGLATGAYLVATTDRTVLDVDPDHPDYEDVPPAYEDAFLPHASVWPFAVGLGAVVVGNGVALGLWALVPGGILLTYALVGYGRQSRYRD
jgi:hypothetical protein